MGRKFITIVGIFFLFLTFYFKGIFYLDPDFGWHLGMGKYILEHGIPKIDPFSYTMPSYPFVDHEWLTNIAIYKLYSNSHTWGLAAIAATLTLAALLISLPKGLNKWSIIPLLLGVAVILPFAGIRPQVETWFFLAILLKVILNKDVWVKWRFVLPLLFIIWVNVHGGFAVGIVALLIILLGRVWEQKRINMGDLLVLLTSILVTFLNPYGLRIWWEVWMQISDGSLRWSIAEWVPMFFRLDPVYLLYLVFSCLIVWRYQKKLELAAVVLFIILGMAAISSQRHIPLWVIVSLPLTTYALEYFYNEVRDNSLALHRFNVSYKIFLLVTFILLTGWSTLTLRYSRNYNESATYPKQAIGYLKNHPPKKHIFALYSWGGYLIWKLPEHKVFIDGRMPSWRWISPSRNESNQAFVDYNKVLNNQEALTEIFTKFDVETVIWPAPSIEDEQTLSSGNKKSGIVNILQSKYEQLVGIKPVKPLLKRLKEAGWREVYRDNVAMIYQKL